MVLLSRLCSALTLRASLVVATLCLANSVCHAQKNFDNGNASTGILPMEILSDDSLPLHIADDFVLPGGRATISRVMWFGYFAGIRHDDPIPNRQFNVLIYDGTSAVGLPGVTPIHAFYNVSPNVSYVMSGGVPKKNFGTFPILRFDLRIPRISLAPDRRYWICIYASATTGVDHFAWAHTNSAGNISYLVPGYMTSFNYVSSFSSYHTNGVSFKLYE